MALQARQIRRPAEVAGPGIYGARYEDVGCHVYHECLSCPLPRCIEEVAMSVQLTRMRDAKIIQMYFEYNIPANEIPSRISRISHNIVKSVVEKERKHRRENNSEESDYREYLIDLSILTINKSSASKNGIK